MRTGESQHPLGEGVRLLQATGQQMRFCQWETTQRLKACHVRGHGLFHRRREQRHGVGDAPRQDMRCPQGRSHPGDKEPEGRFLTDAHGPFKEGQGPGQVALAEEQQTDAIRGPHQAAGMRHCLSNLQSFFPEHTALSKQAQLGMTRSEESQGLHRGQHWLDRGAHGAGHHGERSPSA